MDESALVPTVLYVMLTAFCAGLAFRTFDWLDVTGTAVALVALLVVIESGVAYEGVKKAMRPWPRSPTPFRRTDFSRAAIGRTSRQ